VPLRLRSEDSYPHLQNAVYKTKLANLILVIKENFVITFVCIKKNCYLIKIFSHLYDIAPETNCVKI